MRLYSIFHLSSVEVVHDGWSGRDAEMFNKCAMRTGKGSCSIEQSLFIIIAKCWNYNLICFLLYYIFHAIWMRNTGRIIFNIIYLSEFRIPFNNQLLAGRLKWRLQFYSHPFYFSCLKFRQTPIKLTSDVTQTARVARFFTTHLIINIRVHSVPSQNIAIAIENINRTNW